MTGGGPANPALEAAFRAALLHQGTVALLIFVLLAIAWVASRELMTDSAKAQLITRRQDGQAEPVARAVLRIGFGVLWLFDGLLQTQPAMPGGLPSRVIAPAAASSPGWVRHVVDWASAAWSYHPVQAASGAVWIQLGLGAWLIASGPGRWSRVAALASGTWGLIVWIFGEAFGGIFGPGLSWLTGAPGGVLFYCAAAALLALPTRLWSQPRLGQIVLAVCGAELVGFAVLQAWPGRGFWQGSVHGHPGPLTAMLKSMAAVRQPSGLAALENGFASMVVHHGFAVNMIAVIVLALAGAAMLTARLAIARPAALTAIAFCLADWVLVQDFGFFGGLGTDPNSMLPQALLLAAGLLAVTTAAPAAVQTAASATATVPATASAFADVDDQSANRLRLRPGSLARRAGLAFGSTGASSVIGLWAAALVVMGAAPMAMAEATRHPQPGTGSTVIDSPSLTRPAIGGARTETIRPAVRDRSYSAPR